MLNALLSLSLNLMGKRNDFTDTYGGTGCLKTNGIDCCGVVCCVPTLVSLGVICLASCHCRFLYRKKEMSNKEENPTDEAEVLGVVQITVYNDCFAIKHTANLSMDDIAGLFISALDKMGGETEERVVH